MYACNGILFNHESPRRGETFVTRKITRLEKNVKEKQYIDSQKEMFLTLRLCWTINILFLNPSNYFCVTLDSQH